MNAPAARKLKFEIFRYNPEIRPEPRMETFELEETPFMSLYLALNKIREEYEPTLQFDFVCRSAVCGSCGMMVNGRPSLACKTLTSQLDSTIRLHPLPAFKLVGDLSVDTGSWFRGMAERIKGWIEEKQPFDPNAVEERMDDDLAQAIYERERCIECGCCVASCAVANTRPAFVAPAGLNRVARFMMDPRDRRDDGDWYEVVASDEGVFGCLGLMGCQDVCPKELPLREVYAYLRRKSLSGLLGKEKER